VILEKCLMRPACGQIRRTSNQAISDELIRRSAISSSGDQRSAHQVISDQLIRRSAISSSGDQRSAHQVISDQLYR
jgi:hypothetical protein